METAITRLSLRKPEPATVSIHARPLPGVEPRSQRRNGFNHTNFAGQTHKK